MLSDGLFLYGVRAKNILEAKGMNKKKLHIIYNSLDFEKQKKLYNDLINKKKASFQKTASSKFERIIIYVGRITRDKKLDKAVLILSELNRYKKKYRLIFVGSGPEIGALKKLAENYNVLESIDFIGPCYDEVLLAKYIMLADVMLVPGDIGLTAIHAMTYGTPGRQIGRASCRERV